MLEIDAVGNEKVARIIEYLNASEEIPQYWKCANVVARDRLGYNDHGEKHVEIVTRKALQLLRILRDKQTPNIVSDYDMTEEDAEVIIVLAGLLHDVGHVVHRYHHSEYSLFVANNLIDQVLEDTGLYTARERVIIKSETLHAIQSHHRKAHPLTLEAGILRVADALDMEKGRAREPDDIHSVSALSVEHVTINEQDGEKPVRIDIELNNSSGIFQVDYLFRQKIEGSGLEDLIGVRAEVKGSGEKKLIDTYEL